MLVLQQIHDELDAAEEQRGHLRWVRPEFQNLAASTANVLQGIRHAAESHLPEVRP